MAVGAFTWRATMSNTTMGGAANPAMIGFTTVADPGVAQPELAAAIIVYLSTWLGNNGAAGSSVDQLYYRDAPGNVEVPVPFPAAEVAALLVLHPTYSGGTLYGQTFGAGQPAGLGVGICVSEYSTMSGRSRRGRHFLPYVAEASMDAGGLLIGAQAAANTDVYEALLRDSAVALLNWQMAVWSPTLGVKTAIQQVVTRQVPTLLRSRRA